jgi:hypothetical protein
MCQFTTLYQITEKENIEPLVNMMNVPAVVPYFYSPETVVHALTGVPIDDHLFTFKVQVEHVTEPVYILMDNGSCVGFTESDVCDNLEAWKQGGIINNDELHEMIQYFIEFFGSGWCTSKDQLTSATRTYHFNPQNWLMFYVRRVDLRGMIPPEWYHTKVENRRFDMDRQVRARIPDPIRANSPIMANNDIYDMNLSDDDGETIGSIDTWSISQVGDPLFDIEFTFSDSEDDN